MQQRGFTLIELIIVIVILGILAVTAAPRFIDLSSDANRSVLRGVQAAIQSGAQLVYARSAIAGEQANENTATSGDTTQVDVNGQPVETNYGYPDADEASITSLPNWLQIDVDDPGEDSDFALVIGSGAAAETSPAAGTFAIYSQGQVVDFTGSAPGRCYVLYTEAAINGSPQVDVVDDDC